jgi:hypothetical protein
LLGRQLREHPEFQEGYVRAREIQADILADEIIEIADTEPDPQKDRNLIDARKWLAGKLRPKRYGDHLKLDHTVESNPGIQVTLSFGPAPEQAVLDVEPEKPALPS